MTSKDILKLLADKHSKDVFIPECKTGRTYNSKHLRLDAWVMNRSWDRLKFTGYEIKVSRSDFLADDKYHGYMEVCNEFYFVTLKGVCSIHEIPQEAGLYEIATTGNKILTKKKAVYRNIEFPSNLFVYILMCRTKIINWDTCIDNIEYWEQWLENKKYKENLGRSVSRKLKENYKKNVWEVKEENDKLYRKIQEYDKLKELLNEIGITDKDTFYEAKKKIIALKDSEMISILESTLEMSNRTIENILNNIYMLKQNNLQK